MPAKRIASPSSQSSATLGFEEHRAKLFAGLGDYAGANAEDREPSRQLNPAIPEEARATIRNFRIAQSTAWRSMNP